MAKENTGSPLVVKFMKMSCFTASFYGAATLIAPWSLAGKYMYPAAEVATEESFDAFRYLMAAALLGWANGKYQAIQNGPVGCVRFCKTNVIPMLIMVGSSARAGAWDTPIWAAFTAAYVYFGYVA